MLNVYSPECHDSLFELTFVNTICILVIFNFRHARKVSETLNSERSIEGRVVFGASFGASVGASFPLPRGIFTRPINCYTSYNLCCNCFLGSVGNDIDYLASNMEVRYDVLDNLLPIPSGSLPTFLSEITLINKGSLPIGRGTWSVYFCNIRLVEPEHLKHNPAGYVIPGKYGIKFTHINGCLHKFETTTDFKDIAAGDSFTFRFKASYHSVARTDVMPRWYLAVEGSTPRVIYNTDNEELSFVGKFDTKEKWKRTEDDVYDPYTPAKRYNVDFVSDLKIAPNDVIPTPVEMDIDENSGVTVTSDWTVYIQAGLENEAAPVKGMFGIFTSCHYLIRKGGLRDPLTGHS